MIKILVWGTGEIEKEFSMYLNSNVEIIGYINTYKTIDIYKGIKVYYPKEILQRMGKTIQCDYLVVASVYSNEIFGELKQYSIDKSKVIFLRPFQVSGEIDDYFRGLQGLGEIAEGYLKIAKRESGIQMAVDSKEKLFCDEYPLYYWDYFRYRTFELIADQIKSLEGAVAEAGVFKVFFSKLINNKFPEAVLYMFDSFEGFDIEEAEDERYKGHCNQEFIETFRDTSVEKVLAKMPYKEKCIIKKGFFPKSAEGIDEVFKFVSIDFDFEKSIYEALEWFYPRMVKGRYIFIHDYNEPTLVGVKNAVNRYEQKFGKLVKVPIADKCGTLIVYKL